MTLQEIETRLKELQVEQVSSVSFFEFEKAGCYLSARELFINNVDFGRWIDSLEGEDTRKKVGYLIKCRNIFSEVEYMDLGYSKAFELISRYEDIKASTVYSEWIELKKAVIATPENYTALSVRVAMTALKDKIPKKETPKQELERLRKEVITHQERTKVLESRIVELEVENESLRLAIENISNSQA